MVAAVRRQLDALMHSGGAVGHRPARDLAARLVEIAPPGLDHILSATTGSEAIELALQAARHATGRAGVVSFRGGFHGRTLGALACSTGRDGAGGVVLPGGVAVAPFPRPGAWGSTPRRPRPSPSRASTRYTATSCPPTRRPATSWSRSRAGEGATPRAAGSWRASASAPTATASCWPASPSRRCWPGRGSSARCRPRCTDPRSAATRFGGRALAALFDLRSRVPWVAEVRGVGLMIGIELADPATRRPRPDLAAAVVAAARDAGVLVIRSGAEGEVVRLLPPLTLTDAELDHGIAVLRRALAAAAAA